MLKTSSEQQATLKVLFGISREGVGAIWRRLRRPLRLRADLRHFNLRRDRTCTHGLPFKTAAAPTALWET
jgi:hypothetical protein